MAYETTSKLTSENKAVRRRGEGNHDPERLSLRRRHMMPIVILSEAPVRPGAALGNIDGTGN